ncbi:MAG: TonB-dependent receptor domain-containing protein [Salinibacter sp.]|uniref:TonB-dependent receptor n=1 Tax=Salinibacter sp. TaxID=2065818 RepID=UPI0035D4E17C
MPQTRLVSSICSCKRRARWAGTALLFGLMLLLAPVTAQAQAPGTIEGRVVDAESGDPLVGANLKVIGTQRGTSTDTEGRFVLSVPPGRLTVRASFVGYTAVQKEIEVEAGGTAQVRFRLQPGSTLDNVVVVGSRAQGRSALRSAVPVDAISVDQLTVESPQTDLNQLLNYTAPSFQVNRQSAADATEFVDPATLRSLPPDQLLVLVNGKRRHKSSLINTLNTVGRGAAGTDLNAIPAAAVSQIEVLRNGASAQYGSDAIAGVINLQLKEATNQLTASVTTGAREVRGGDLVKVEANYGFDVGDNGFVNVTGMFKDRQRTNITDGNQLILFNQPVSPPFAFAYPLANNPDQVRQRDNQILRERGLTRKDFYYRVGQSGIQQGAVFLNSEFGLQNGATLYAFGGLSYKNGIGAPFRRRPFSTAAMPWLPSNENPRLFPNGFQPEMNSDVVDQSITIGVKGTIGGWNWDLSNTFGRNSLDYQMDNTVNASLLQASPTSIYAGKHAFSQNTANLDVSRFFADVLAGVNVAFGGAYRIDHYQIFAGEEASYRDYGRVQLVEDGQLVTRDTLGKDPGSQGFVGFRPENEVDRTRSNVAAYVDTEWNLTEQLLVTAAGRFENYSDFGRTLNGRLAARLGLFDGRLNLRGSISNGFRAPSLHQLYFNEVRTDLNDEGELVNIGTFSNDSEVARVLGFPRLDEERSRNYSAGITASPIENLDLTIDAYQINVDDRVVLTGTFGSSPGIAELLREVGAQNAQLFANGADTKTQGLDVVATYRLRTDLGTADLSASANFNDTEIEALNIPATVRQNYDGEDLRSTFFGRQQQGFLTESNPESKLTLSADLERGPVSLLVRTVRFGEQIRPGFAGNQTHSPQWVVDATASYQISEEATLSVGANNLFNNFPDKQIPGNSFFGVFDYAPVQQGFNGAFYFARLNLRL